MGTEKGKTIDRGAVLTSIALYEQTTFFWRYVSIQAILYSAGDGRRARILQEGAHAACDLLLVLFVFHDVFDLGRVDVVWVLFAGATAGERRLWVWVFGREGVWGSGFSGR
jgi:hypothetical protein